MMPSALRLTSLRFHPIRSFHWPLPPTTATWVWTRSKSATLRTGVRCRSIHRFLAHVSNGLVCRGDELDWSSTLRLGLTQRTAAFRH